MNITLSKALKMKNSIVKDLRKIDEYLGHNSCSKENSKFSIDLKSKWEEYDENMKKLVNLKTAIARANVDINEKIFLLSELKAKIEKFRMMPTTEGFTSSLTRYGTESERQTEMVVQYNQSAVASLIKGYEKDIEAIQDEIDAYNATHFIEI